MNKKILVQGVDVTTAGVLKGEQTDLSTDPVEAGSTAALQRDLVAAFNEWSAAKRFRVSEQPAAGR